MTEAPRPLERAMSMPAVLWLTLSAATPASSFFVIVPDVLRETGTAALWAMAGAALVAVCVAQIYAELASAFPYSGGEYAMTARVLGPAAGFAVLAVNTLNLLLAVAVLGRGVAEQLSPWLPGASPAAVALACTALATGAGVLNVRANAAVTGACLAVELLAVGWVAALGFAAPERGLGALLAHPVRLAGAGLGPAGAMTATLGVAGALFAYDGYGSACYFGEELRKPRRGVARAVLWAVGLVTACELAPLAAVLTGAPDLRAVLADGVGAFVAARAGAGAAAALRLVVALAILNAAVALTLLAARQLYGAARDGAWPRAADRALLAVHPRWGSPWGATLAAGAGVAALCLLPLRLLVVLSGTGVTLIYAALCVTLVVGRRTGGTAAAAHRAPLSPWLPGATLAVLGGVLAADAWSAGDGRVGLFATAATAVAGALWGAAAARAGRWRPTAPADDAL